MPLESSITPQSRTQKPPRLVISEDICAIAPIFAFPPNRDTLGGTSYLIVEKDGNLMIDCPAWDENTRSFLAAQGGVRQLILTHRGGMGKVQEIQAAFDCDVIVQEQEAYLLPNVKVTPFQGSLTVAPQIELIWTSGHSPGSACVYHVACGGILFTGRHLLPNAQGNPVPLRTAKTFHWNRQVRHVKKLLDRFSPETLRFICPGASLGLLRGKFAIDHAYSKLSQLDLDACFKSEALL